MTTEEKIQRLEARRVETDDKIERLEARRAEIKEDMKLAERCCRIKNADEIEECLEIQRGLRHRERTPDRALERARGEESMVPPIPPVDEAAVARGRQIADLIIWGIVIGILCLIIF